MWLSLLDPEAPITLAKSKFGEVADGSCLVCQQPHITEVSTATPTAATAACAVASAASSSPVTVSPVTVSPAAAFPAMVASPAAVPSPSVVASPAAVAFPAAVASPAAVVSPVVVAFPAAVVSPAVVTSPAAVVSSAAASAFATAPATAADGNLVAAYASGLASPIAADLVADVGFIQLPLVECCAIDDGPPTRPLAHDILCRIERGTREQSNSDYWFRQRSHRVTASRFHSIVNSKKEVTTAFLEGLFRSRNSAANQVSVAPLEHGRRYEDVAAKEYVPIMHLHDKTALKVFKCGFCVHPLHSFIGASPDTLVYDSSVQTRHGLLDVKCSILLFDNDLTPHDACMTYPDFCCSLQEFLSSIPILIIFKVKARWLSVAFLGATLSYGQDLPGFLLSAFYLAKTCGSPVCFRALLIFSTTMPCDISQACRQPPHLNSEPSAYCTAKKYYHHYSA